MVVAAILTSFFLALSVAPSAYADGDGFTTSGNWPGGYSTQMKRLAHCAAYYYWTTHATGGSLNQCDGAGSNSQWDTGSRDGAGVYSHINAVRVDYQNGNCPGGGHYIKCYYVNGNAKGHPVMMLRWESLGAFGGGDFTVRWYFL